MKLRIDGFMLALMAALALAWLLPELGSQLSAWQINKAGVTLIFFLHGLALPAEALREGTRQVKLHAVVQASTFLLFPLLGWLASLALPEAQRAGILFLSALPSTVSSSVALTAVARGNVSAAIFNASLSSLLGVVLTPLWMQLLLGASGASLPLGKVVLDLALFLLLPFAAGQTMRRIAPLRELAAKHKPIISKIDRGSILLLVYTSFCDSINGGVWQRHGLTTALIACAVSLALLCVVLALTACIANAAGFARAERITAVFCGSKKTLAAGVPMAQLIFGAGPLAGLVILPLLAYHTLQLVVCSALATRWASGSSFLIGDADTPADQELPA
jgi:sodium/bile acid cotransporter 7